MQNLKMKTLTQTRIIDTTIMPMAASLSAAGVALATPSNAYAFDSLKNGFENLTKMYLLPLSGAVAGCALLVYITLSYFKKDEYQKYVGNIFGLAILASAGLSLIEALTKSFR